MEKLASGWRQISFFDGVTDNPKHAPLKLRHLAQRHKLFNNKKYSKQHLLKTVNCEKNSFIVGGCAFIIEHERTEEHPCCG